MERSIAEGCLLFTGLYEAELLTELLLRHWNHPKADDREFRSDLLEAAAEVLQASVGGERLMQDLSPPNMNFVAAVWYAESVSMEQPDEAPPWEVEGRRMWLTSVLRAIPSCFCDPGDLGRV